MQPRYLYSISAVCRITGKTWPWIQPRLAQLEIEPVEIRDDEQLWFGPDAIEKIRAYLAGEAR
jgi:hypothetical protein